MGVLKFAIIYITFKFFFIKSEKENLCKFLLKRFKQQQQQKGIYNIWNSFS